MAEAHLDAGSVLGVALEMPEQRCRLSSDLELVVAHAFLKLTPAERGDWKRIRAGDRVRFECTVSAGSKVFPGVRVQRYKSGGECHLLLALVEPSLVGVVSST